MKKQELVKFATYGSVIIAMAVSYQAYVVLTASDESSLKDLNISATLEVGAGADLLQGSSTEAGTQTAAEGALAMADNDQLIAQAQMQMPPMGDIRKPIEAQLEALRANDTNRAYSNVSKEFREATSMDAFRNFLRQHPILTQHKSVTFTTPVVEGSLVKVTAVIQGDQGSPSMMEYTLIREGNELKVFGFRITTPTSDAEQSGEKERTAIIATIQDQLAALRALDLTKAYAFTSKEFQAATSFTAFSEFVKSFPVFFQNKSATFGVISPSTRTLVITARLSADGGNADVEYRMVQEGDRWKVWSMQVMPPSSTATDKPVSGQMEFSKAIFGTVVDLQGLVTNPFTNLSPDFNRSRITVNVYVRGGTVGNKVEVILEHVDSGSRIAPVSSDLESAGDSVVSFIYTPPSQGWPRGNYKLYVNGAKAQQKTFTFKVE